MPPPIINRVKTLSAEQDPMGAAIHDFFYKKKLHPLVVHSSLFEDDEMPIPHFFRTLDQCSAIEKRAIQESKGRILDVGAGAGAHSLPLQAQGKEVKAIDLSHLSVDVMKQRGVKDAECINFYDLQLTGPFDTILLLMNGAGFIGKLDNISNFLQRMKLLLAPDGQILMDSSDLRYLYEEEDGSFLIDINAGYYGEIDYEMSYGEVHGPKFDWLYIDFDTLNFYCKQAGFHVESIADDGAYAYLARLTHKKNEE